MISESSMGASSKGESSWVQRSSNAYRLPPTLATRTRYPSRSPSSRAVASSSASVPMSTQRVIGVPPRKRLEHSRLQARGLGHHRLVPWRIEHELDVGRRDGRDDLELLTDILHEHVAHAAPGRGQGEPHVDLALAVRSRTDRAFVDESEVHDVDRDLGVVTR